jgi:DNA repair protein RadC
MITKSPPVKKKPADTGRLPVPEGGTHPSGPLVVYDRVEGVYRPATTSEVCEIATKLSFEKAIRAMPVVRSVADLKEYLAHQAGIDFEQFGVIFLDNRHRVIDMRILFSGTVDVTPVYFREIARACINNNASRIVVFHNHPSGCSEPSPQDITMTRALTEAMALLSIHVIDHVLIAGLKAVSFYERGIELVQLAGYVPPEK